MKDITIILVYENIKEVIVDKGRNLIIKYNNGDRVTLYKSDYSDKVRRHLLRNFGGEHLD